MSTHIHAVVLEMVDPQRNHRKFWEAYQAVRPDGGSRIALRWGRIGTAGGSQVKDFGGQSEAQRWLDRKIGEKLGEGYDSKPIEACHMQAGERLLALPKPEVPRTPNLLEKCEQQIAAAAEAVGTRKGLSPSTVDQYRAAKIAYVELERRFNDLTATLDTISELYEQKVTA